MSNVPCEVVEIESPVVIERYGFASDSGGAGQFRGGLALVRDFRFVGEEAILQVRSDRRKYLPYGLDGGRPGTPSQNVLNPDREAQPRIRSARIRCGPRPDGPRGRPDRDPELTSAARRRAKLLIPSKIGSVSRPHQIASRLGERALGIL